MPNEEHVRILGLGVLPWNIWREEEPEVEPDLSSNLTKTTLTGANFARVDLRSATLDEATLISADLSKTKLGDTRDSRKPICSG